MSNEAESRFEVYLFAYWTVRHARARIISEMQNCNEYDAKLDFANKKLLSVETYLDVEKRRALSECVI